MGMTRVLYGERVSTDKKERTDSIERQEAKLEERRVQEQKTRDLVVVGRAIDPGVSGDINMFDRPQLGMWLTPEGLDKWDELWVTTQDRLSRNDIHFLAFVFKIIEWGKTLVVLDDPSLDLLTPEGRLIAHAKAMTPAKELTRIKARVADSHQTRLYTEAWPGGVPTYGYVTEYKMVADKRRKVLTLDEYMVTVLHEMRAWLVNADDPETVKGVFARLEARGELTAKDRWRTMIGRKPKGEKWSPSSVKQLLTSPALRGQKLHGTEPLFHPDGRPVIIAPPIFDDHEWGTLQAAIAKRSREPYRQHGASPLLQVTFCGKCGASATHVVTTRQLSSGEEKSYRYYRCTNQRQLKPCPKVSMIADQVEEIVEQTFLEEAGHINVATRTWVPGEDAAEELREVRAAIARLDLEKDTARYWDEEDEENFVRRKTPLIERRNALKQVKSRESGWEYHDTGRTYREAWSSSDPQQRRRLLVDAGVRFDIFSISEWNCIVPPDLVDRLRRASLQAV
jgi:site-specific DNA recombinase